MNTPEEIMDRIAAWPNPTSFLVHFSSVPAALEAVKKLSFVDSSRGLALPEGIECGVFKSTTGAIVIIGGKLSNQVRNEVFNLFQKYGEIKSIALPPGVPPMQIQSQKVESKGLEEGGIKSVTMPPSSPPAELKPQVIEGKKEEQAQPITPKWYLTQSDYRHVRQVVVTLPPESKIPPRVDNLVSSFTMTEAKWAVESLFLTGDTPEVRGPFVFAKASGVVEMLIGYPVSVAFAFYRLNYGGIFQLFVQVDSPKVRAKVGSPYLAEHSRWPDEENDCRLVEALIGRDKLEVCFVSPGENGPCTGFFGLRVDLPEVVTNTLKKEWAELLTYHKNISNRNYQESLNQYNRENPISGTPVLPKEIIIPFKKKKWWEFWKTF